MEATASACPGFTPRRMAISGVGARGIMTGVRLGGRGQGARAPRRETGRRPPPRRGRRTRPDSAPPTHWLRRFALRRRKEPPGLGDLRADEEAGEIFARVVFGEAAHEGQAAGAEQGAEEAQAPSPRTAAAPRSRRVRRRRRAASSFAARAKAPASVWSLIAAKSSPVTNVRKRSTRPFSTIAHLECEPGRTIRRRAGIRDAQDFDLLAAHHVGLSVPRPRRTGPGASRTTRSPASTATSLAAMSRGSAGHFT